MAQTTFTESAAAFGLNLGQNKDGGHAWSDFDNDGDLDVLVLENNNNSSVKSYLMQNNAGVFTNVQSTLVPGMLGDRAERQAVWGDLNNDGRPDFMINSSGTTSSRVALQIYLQNTTGTFGDGAGGTVPITIGENSSHTITINPINSEGAGFFDFEGDGDLDIFFDSHNYGIELLRNNYIDHTTSTIVNPPASGLFTHITPGNGSGVVQFGLNQFATDGDYGTAADVDDDGWVDIFMRKRDENDFFLNAGGTFTNGADLAQADNSNKGANGLWDLDNDGDLDAVWTENGLTQIYRNDGAGIWTALGAAVFPGLPQPSNTDRGTSSAGIDALAGGDIDNDGDIDVLLVGNNRSYLFINQLNSPNPAPGTVGSGAPMTFSLDSQTFNSGRDGEGTTMVDIDDDGDLDIYININGNANQLYINNLPLANRNNHLIVDVTEDRGPDGSTGAFPGRVAIGTNVLIRDCQGNIVSGLRQVNGVFGHGTQQPEQVHFGLPLGEAQTYLIEVHYPNFNDPVEGVTRLIATGVAQPILIPGTNHYTLTTTDAESLENVNAPVANDDLEVVPFGNTVNVQISLFDNDFEPDGENFSIESVTQPAVGTVTIVDANNGLVNFSYSAGTPFPGTTFTYTITDSNQALCPASGKSDTATVTVSEPCANPTGLDTDGDGINDICDFDDDNDGIPDGMENNCGPDVSGFDAHWPVDATTDDASGNGYDQQAGSVGFSNESIRGIGSASFDGVANYLQYSDGTFLNQQITDFSFSFWIKPTDLIGVQTLLDEGGGTNGIAIRLNGNVLENAVREGGAGSQVSTSSFTFPDDGRWHHVALTYDNGDVVMYFDGVPSTTLSTGFGSLAAHGSAHSFGRSSGDAFGQGTGNYYGGLMDEIVHYPTVLSQSDIDDLINGTCDNDNDGVRNIVDLDSDNDGIYDVVEAGHDETHTAGRLNGAVGADGLDDNIQGVGQEDSGIINYTILDSDADGNQDFIETDSDSDGCVDVLEAGYTESGTVSGELQGTGYNASTGVVTGNTDGYTAPADGDTNSVFDYREAGVAPSITVQPADTTLCPGCTGSMSVTATNADTYQWQLFNGSVWVNLNDSGIYSGTTTQTLTLTNPTTAENGNQYRVLVSNSAYSCSEITSNAATLTVVVNTVITNRRITYRVNKN